MSPLFEVPKGDGHHSVFQPGEHDIEWLGLEALSLTQGEDWQGETGDFEAVLVIFSGSCSISIQGQEHVEWTNLGSRADVFRGAATSVYVPRASQVSVVAERDLEAAIVKSPCDVDLSPALISPDDVRILSSGMANWRRDIRLIIPPGSPLSQRLIVGETVNPPGNWSGIPPHKHDVSTNIENFLEELYLFKVKPDDSYGVQLIYSAGEEHAHIIGTNDVAVMLSGYHPTVASPGTTIYYLWVLAGDSKAYDISIDPRFGWVRSAEDVLKEQQKS